MLKVVQGWCHNKVLRLAHAIAGGHVIYAIRTHDGPKNKVVPYVYTPYFVLLMYSLATQRKQKRRRKIRAALLKLSIFFLMPSTSIHTVDESYQKISTRATSYH